jgi:hypothetical protein
LGARPEPAGLHAKLFILETGWDAMWLVGSANATEAALLRRRNVEFMVGLRGRRSRVGIDKVLGADDDDSALRALLRPYAPGCVDTPVDPNQQRAEDLANRVRDWLIALRMRLEVEQQGSDRFRLVLVWADPGLPAPDGHAIIAFWPITLPSERALPLDPSATPTPGPFSDLSLLALTPFIAFDIVAQVKDRKYQLRFVLNLPITGIPEDRDDRLFATIISDRSKFLRYLWLILAGGEGGPPAWLNWLGVEEGQGTGGLFGDAEMPLLETLVRALSRSPEKIERIGDLVERLKRTPEGQSVLPEGFQALWHAVIRTRSSLQ